MYREHDGPPPPDPYEPGRQNARNCGLVQLGGVGMTAFTLVVTCFRLGAAKLPPNFPVDPADVSAFKHTALAGVVVYLVVLGVWAALNHWGLQRRSKLAYVSSIAFAIACILSCFPALFGGVLLFLLFKPEMKGYFDDRPAP